MALFSIGKSCLSVQQLEVIFRARCEQAMMNVAAEKGPPYLSLIRFHAFERDVKVGREQRLPTSGREVRLDR